MPYYRENQPLRRPFSIEKRAPKRAPNLKIIFVRAHWTNGGSSLNERLKIFPRPCIVAGIQCELMQLSEAAQLPLEQDGQVKSPTPTTGSNFYRIVEGQCRDSGRMALN